MSDNKQTLTKEKILSFLREHKEQLHADFGVTKIALFGSYARDEQGPESDVDLLFETDDHSFKTYCNLKRFFEENLSSKVDIVSHNSLRTFIKRSIEPELLYA